MSARRTNHADCNGFSVCEGTFSLLEHKRETYNTNSSTASTGGRYASCTPSARRAVAVSTGRRGEGNGQKAGHALGEGDASALVLAARLEVEAVDVLRGEGRVRVGEVDGSRERPAVLARAAGDRGGTGLLAGER